MAGDTCTDACLSSILGVWTQLRTRTRLRTEDRLHTLQRAGEFPPAPWQNKTSPKRSRAHRFGFHHRRDDSGRRGKTRELKVPRLTSTSSRRDPAAWMASFEESECAISPAESRTRRRRSSSSLSDRVRSDSATTSITNVLEYGSVLAAQMLSRCASGPDSRART